MIKIAISGICGKMGRRILDLAKEDEELRVILGLEAEGHPQIGESLEGIDVFSDPQRIKDCDCLIEFSSPQATIEHLEFLGEFKKAAVIGTTGFSKSQEDEIKEVCRIIPIVFSPNMSVGVNLLFKLIRETAQILKGYDVHIEETHHVHKKDAPSGTAKKITQVINEQGFDINIGDIRARRIGEVIGDHKVVFQSNVDKIELSHSATSRDIFAQGALVAAKWVVGKPSGLYSMEEVLFG